MARLKKALLPSLAVLALLAGWIVLRRNAPPLRIIHAPNTVTVDVATLGEYPTTIDRIRLLDSGGTVVWEVSAKRGDAQIYRLILRPGNNPAQLEADHGMYQVVTPKSADYFVLSADREYRIELRGRSGLLSQRSASFAIP